LFPSDVLDTGGLAAAFAAAAESCCFLHFWKMGDSQDLLLISKGLLLGGF
jgi:hypothetical protein